jgi:hypothetical protein
VVNSIKAPNRGPIELLVGAAQTSKKKHPFMDFREIVRSGLRASWPHGGGAPVEPGRAAPGVGTPLAEGHVARLAEVPEHGSRSARPACEDDCVGLHAPLDALEIALAAPPIGAPRPSTDVTPGSDLAAAIFELVRRISWGGDRRSGTARIELGAGVLAGGSILVQALGRQVQVEIELPAGFDGRALQDRLRERLVARGIDVQALTVR